MTINGKTRLVMRSGFLCFLLGACVSVPRATQPTPSAKTVPFVQPIQTSSPVTSSPVVLVGPTAVSTDDNDRDSVTTSTATTILELMYHEEIVGASTDMITTTSELPAAPYQIVLNTLTPIDERHSDKWLAVAAASQGVCHICQVRVDAAIVERDGEAWRLESMTKGLATMGSMGQIAPGLPVQIGPYELAVMVKGSYAMQGSYQQDTAIIGSLRDQAALLLLFRDTDQQVYTSAECVNHEEDSKCRWGYTSTLAFVPGNQSDVFDLQITYAGTRQDGSPVDEVNVLTMTENGYQRGP